MNKDKSFDDIIKSKMEKDDLHLEPKGWEQMQKALNAHKEGLKVIPIKRNQKLWQTVAAIASCLIVMLGVGYVFTTNKPEIGTQIAQKNKNSNIQDIAAIVEAQQIQEEDNIQEQPFNTPISSTNELVVEKHNAKTAINSHPSEIENNNIVKTKDPDFIATKDIKETKTIDKTDENYQRKSEQEIQYLLKQYLVKDADVKPNTYAKQSTNVFEIGLNGGINYGTLNQGYTMGVVAKANVAKDVYVDGTIGINISNNSSLPIVNVNSTKVLARPGKDQLGNSGINTPAITNQRNQLIYVQFNPSVGYNVAKNISFAVGGDIQQLLSDKAYEGKNVAFNARKKTMEVLPNTDFGITTKTEFRISKSINAGLLYREGLNSYVANGSDGINYANRRYIQLQLKYNIPL